MIHTNVKGFKMKIAVLVLANDEFCVCGRCTKEGGDGGGRSYKPMIEAIRNTWASSPPDGVKVYYIYGHREGIEFPDDAEYREVNETYWPDNQKQVVTKKRFPFAIEDCIYSDTPEGRENLYYKCIDGFEWLLENDDFDYLIRPSAGSYVDLPLFKASLENIGVVDDLYAGSVGVYDNSHNHARNPQAHPKVLKFASGSCFIASRKLIEDLVANRNNIDPVMGPHKISVICDDVTFAKHFGHDLGAQISPFMKYEMTLPEQASGGVGYAQCYFRHTINPELHYAVHRAKGYDVGQ